MQRLTLTSISAYTRQSCNVPVCELVLTAILPGAEAVLLLLARRGRVEMKRRKLAPNYCACRRHAALTGVWCVSLAVLRSRSWYVRAPLHQSSPTPRQSGTSSSCRVLLPLPHSRHCQHRALGRAVAPFPPCCHVPTLSHNQ